jgi:hypothetical protein
VIVLSDPQSLVRPDGKPGYTPPKGDLEWVDAEVPSWTSVEDYALLTVDSLNYFFKNRYV